MHIVAWMRYHLHIQNPWDLITEDANGDLDFTQFSEVWNGLDWVLRRERQMQA